MITLVECTGFLIGYFEWFITHPIYAFLITLFQFAFFMVTRPKWENTILEKPIFVWFIWQDWVVNYMLIVIFWDWPGSWNEVVTLRMKRYLRTYPITGYPDYNYVQKWRLLFAIGLCKVLHIFDPRHCD